MRRYEGFLRGGGHATAWPSRWWIVGVECASSTDTLTGSVRRSSLLRWHGVVLDFDETRCVGRFPVSGPTAGHFWDCFLHQQKQYGPLWVMSPRALMAWQLLGVWDKLETGNLKCPGRSGKKKYLPSGRETNGEYGMLLTADPPTVGRFRHEESGISFTWSCAANYGIGAIHANADTCAQVGKLALSVVESTAVLDRFHLGRWGCTAGSMALRGWLSAYHGSSLYVNSGRSGDLLEMSAVAGGLLLARPTGTEPVEAYSVDCRSMYPWIAANEPQATNLCKRGLRTLEASNAVRRSPRAVLARVEIVTTEPIYPRRHQGRVTYPVGTFTTTLCGPELEKALERDHVREILSCNEYELGTPLADYQQRVYAARVFCESQKMERVATLVKRLGVSLVGKLIQRTELWQECIPDISDPLWGSWSHLEWDGTERHYIARAGVTEVCTGVELAAHAIPSIPLWIWSYGRVMLWKWLSQIPASAVLYVDTDGMLLLKEGYDVLVNSNLLSGSVWGQLRVVSGPLPTVVRGPKNFTMGERIVCAGHPLNQRQSASDLSNPAWYRLPWDQMHEPGEGMSWIERLA